MDESQMIEAATIAAKAIGSFYRQLNAVVNNVEMAKSITEIYAAKFLDDYMGGIRNLVIVEGAIIWYKHGDDGPFWRFVYSLGYYGDAFKAYTANDGSRYGIDDAWIEVEP